MSNMTPPGEEVLAQLGIDPTTIKSIKPNWKRTHYRAIANWLTKYEPPSNPSNLDKIKGYIEAYYHLCELEDWEKASKLLLVQMIYNLEKNYYTQAIESYETMLRLTKKINNKQMTFMELKALQDAYEAKKEYEKAIVSHQELISLLEKVEGNEFKANFLADLELAHSKMKNHNTAINLYEQSLSEARKTINFEAEKGILGRLGNAYSKLGNSDKAVEYYKQSSLVARKLEDFWGEIVLLISLIGIYLKQKQILQVIEPLFRLLIIHWFAIPCFTLLIIISSFVLPFLAIVWIAIELSAILFLVIFLAIIFVQVIKFTKQQKS